MKKLPWTIPGLVIVGAVVLLMLLHWLGALRWWDNLLAATFTPINQGLHQFASSVSQDYRDASEQKDAAEVIRQKDEEIAKLLAVNAELVAIKKDDQILKDYFKLVQDSEVDYLVARVVARDVISRDAVKRNKLVINRGSKDGVRVGLLVVDHSGAALGKISQVKDHLAELSLLTSNDCQLAVAIQNETQPTGIAQGDLGLAVRLDFVPQSKKLAVGELVVSSGLEPNIPRNIVVGKIKSIDEASVNSIWQKLSLEPVANLEDLSFVAVVMPKEGFSF